MVVKRSKKTSLIFITILSLFFNSFGILPENAQASPGNPEKYGRSPGYLNQNKEVRESWDHYVKGLGGLTGNENMYLTVADVQVTGAVSGSGKVLNYSKASESVNNGYPIVDIEEARAWAAIFNGNPAFMTNENGLYGGLLTSGEPGAEPYTGYLLAKVAEMSGGKGLPFTFRPAKSGEQGSWVGVVKFLTTQRPDGSIRTDKSQYQVGDTVKIDAYGKDYSIYNRGLKVLNYYIYNVDTGKTEYTFTSLIKEYPISGEGDGSGATINFPQQTWVPAKAGNYEARILFTDTHARNTKNAPAVGGQGVAYAAPFVVGNPPSPEPPDDDDDDEPPAPEKCSISSTQTKMEIRIEEEKSDRELKNVPSGGETIYVEPGSRIIITAAKSGRFTANGIPMQKGAGNNAKVGVLDAPFDEGPIQIKYESDDGADCWVKTMYVRKKGDRLDNCPIVKLSGSTVRNGETIEVMPGEELHFRVQYTDRYGDVQPLDVYWEVTLPDGKIEKVPKMTDDNGKLKPTRSDDLTLPYTYGKKEIVPLEPGKTYQLRLDLESTNFDPASRPECAWSITIKVRDVSCTIYEQHRIKFYAYGEPPVGYSPGGQLLDDTLLDDGLYFRHLTNTGSEYDTHLGLAADVPGTWYLKFNGQQTPLTGKLAAKEKFHLYLPLDVEAGDTVTLVFISETGCIRELELPIWSDRVCYSLTASIERTTGQVVWRRDVERGEILEFKPEDWIDEYHGFRLFTSDETHFSLRWLDPATNTWEKERDGEWLSSSKQAQNHHRIGFPRDDATGLPLPGFYRVQFYNPKSGTTQCDGEFFVRIGDAGIPNDGENLLIIKSSFTITPNDPQAPGTTATITFDVKNAGKLEHDTKLAVRWESSPTATMLDVNNFKPGEVRKITVPTQYPQQSEDFIANINPHKDRPADETIWPDNRAEWPVKVIGGGGGTIPNPPGGGGNFDGGEIGLKIFDSDGRELQKLQANADGVWEREPAKIRVEIDQTKINDGFARVKQEINQNITSYKSQLEQAIKGDGIKGVSVTATPGWIADAKSMAVYSPAMLDLKVTGPGTPQQWQVSSAGTGGDYVYTGTVVPTQTTWRQVLNAQEYKVEINGFVITMDYNIRFDVSYESCTEDDDGNETCVPHSLTRNMTGRYTITVKGGEREFEVFEPNAKGLLRHTAEWTEYHGRDRYPDSRPNDFYAGERILTSLVLETRHRHPVSGKYPEITAAQAWISETGRRNTPLQSTLELQRSSQTAWQGASYMVPKLGLREMGVDTPLMGDKQRGFQKDASYAVYFHVHFRFGAVKGFAFPNKQQFTGHDQADYRAPFRIIANAWERQGIRNHTTR
jgi:hypothetical protein